MGSREFLKNSSYHYNSKEEDKMVLKTIKGIITLSVFAVIVSGSLHLSTDANAQSDQNVNVRNLINNIKKSIVFLGEVDRKGNPTFYATGFLVAVENIYYLITAKHVVFDPEIEENLDKKMIVFFNSKTGGIGSRSINEIKENYNLNWIFHEDPKIDIAIIPFGLDLAKDDVVAIPDNLFLTSENIFELYDVFFLSYQPGIEPEHSIAPVFRGGIVSTRNDDKSFYIDAFAFPGNSGSPVFLKPSVVRTRGRNILIGDDPLGYKFIGIIGEYIPYQETAISAQTNRPRIIFEENTGLSKIWSVEHIQDIISSDAFKNQQKRIPKR